MAYTKTYTLDNTPAGDTVKEAIVDKLDKNADQIVEDLNTHEALTATHGATGAVVGTTNTQTLTNKTLTSPTIAGATLSGTITNGGTISGGTVNPATLTVAGVAAVTLTGTQTLTNKTLTSPAINTPTISGGTISSATLSSCALSGTIALTNAVLTTPSIIIGSDAIGDMYYRNGAGKVARVPIGTARQMLSVNSEANGQEWINVDAFRLSWEGSSSGAVTGDGTAYKLATVACNENWDRGANCSDGTFVAPRDGKYHFDAVVVCGGLLATHTLVAAFLRRSGGSATGDYYLFSMPNSTAATVCAYNGSLDMELDEGDNMDLYLKVSGGTKSVATCCVSSTYSYFSGHEIV